MSVSRASCFAAITVSLALATGAQAQSQTTTRVAQAGALTAQVRTTWSASGRSEGELKVRGGRATELFAGAGGAATIAAGHDALLVAYAVDARQNPFRVRMVTREGGRTAIGEARNIARPTQRRDMPFAVVATATPDGFSVLFQEIQQDDPSAAHTYLVKLDPEGAPEGAAREVPIPWSLADMLWNGQGYHLALIFPGYGTGPRLSMVSTTPELQPQQHPDWASAAGLIEDVHLAKSGDRILAFYQAGSRLLESDVTQIRGWGSEPPAARRHGQLGRGESILVAVDGGRASARGVRL